MTLALASRRTALTPPWVRDDLWRRARAVPSLDLRFADNKSLVDAVTGASLVTFTRASSGTFVGSDGLIKSATTNEPRFDHNPTTGESLGLLVEEARTNNLTYSEDTSQWLTPTNITLSQNQTTAPDNLVTADQYLETAATGLHAQSSPGFVFVTGTTYTYSVFVKSIGGRNHTIGFPPVVFTARFANFNLSGSGSVQSVDVGITADIKPYPNNWYRCSATSACVLGSGSRVDNFITNSSYSISYAGDVTKGLFIWGAQLEAGAFPTSYIPTVAATVTRAADVASITGSNFSSWYNQTEGTVFANYAERAFSVTHQVATVSNGTANERISLAINSSNVLDVGVISGGADTFGGNTPTLTAQEYRIGFGYKADNSGVSANGSAITVDSAVTLPTVSQLDVGASAGTTQLLNSTIKRLTYWPVRLPDPTPQQITQ